MPRDYTTKKLPVIDEARRQARAFLVVYHRDRTRTLDLRDGQEVTFGRSRQATVPLDDPSISRLHAVVVRKGGRLVARDLGSRNGTRLNGVPLTAEHRLAAGDELGLGEASVVVGMTSPVSRTAPAALGAFMERLAAEVDRGIRYRRRVGLVMLRLEEGPEGGMPVVRDRLEQSLRRMDCLADYSDGELAVLLPEADRDGAWAGAHRLRREGEAVGARLVGGTAVFPDDAHDADELVERAREALRAARQGHGKHDVAAAPPRVVRAQDSLVVADPAMERVFDLARRIAQASITVLVLGETGVGKEILAEEIHRQSPRSDQPFVRLSCAALPEALLEAELFGSERGAFTGANRRRQGYFEAASGGTLLLDEIGDMPEGTQVKLLRVLESSSVIRLGDTQETPVDVRVIAATNRDLEDLVRRGRFREDLYFRVSAFTLHVPPLRDRRLEIPLLCELFVAEIADTMGVPPPEISPAAMVCLQTYAWPGNVRELHNVIERAVVLSSGAIDLSELPEGLLESSGASAAPPAPPDDSRAIRDRVALVERRSIEEALKACGGNQTKAAKRLGISRRALIYKMEKHGLKRRPPRSGSG